MFYVKVITTHTIQSVVIFMDMIKFSRFWTFVLMACMGTGCSMWMGSAFEKHRRPAYTLIEADDGPGVIHSAVVDKEIVSIPVEKSDPPPADYVLGPDDVLHINVFGKPELGSPIVTGTRPLGSRIDGQGNIQLPMVNAVSVAGLTVSQIQQKLQEAFKAFIAKPWVVVEVLEHRSQPIYLVGHFNNPGVYYLDRPTKLVQAIAMGFGLEDTADIRAARVLRDDRVVPVDIYRLLREGAFDQNVWLEPNDTVYVPGDEEQKVYVLGDVKQPGEVAMIHGRMTLAQALAQAGGVGRIGTDWQQVGVIRSLSPTRGELIVIDLEKILEGQALPYPLAAGDIIYVPRDQLGRWNDAISEILPSLQLIGATLQPFVQIRFLSED